MEIHDGYLLTEVIGFCDEFKSTTDSEKEKENNYLHHPLDKEIKALLENLKKGLNKAGDYEEISYESCAEIDQIWNLLIEKAVMCLRYFDKREPFLGNGKIPFVYGLDKLEEYHKEYIDFEGVLYGSDAYYRDHVFHVFRVWLLGVYLLLNTNTKITNKKDRLIDCIHFEGEKQSVETKKESYECKEKLKKGAMVLKEDQTDKKIYEKDGNFFTADIENFSRELNEYEKISMWTVMSLCHDLGYPLEKSKKVLERTEKMMEFFVPQPSINGNISFDGTSDYNNKDIILFISKKMKFAAIDEKDRPTYRASIQEKYKFKYMLSLENFAHGVVSSIIIYKMLIYFKETDNNSDIGYIFHEEDARQFYIRRDILRAMASHTCQDIYHIDVATFPFLLFICDELQEWGRKSWKDAYKGVANNAVKLKLEQFNSDMLSYTETIDMKNAGSDQIVQNIHRIIKRQYLLYQTTFRDGQDTAKRKFDFKKCIEITLNKEYKNIEKIVIEMEINHEKDNKLILKIKDSGEDPKGKKKIIEQLMERIKKVFEQYEVSGKYGQILIEDDRKEKMK